MIDLVQDTAKSYRKLLDSFSRPGEIFSLADYTKNIDIETPFFDSTLLISYILLDGEVSYNIVDPKVRESKDLISRLTYSNLKSFEQSDYIFLTLNGDQELKKEAILQSKVGSFENPHKSATIICEVESLFEGDSYILKGPGIKTQNKIHLNFLNDWLKIRNFKNKEFPLGIDMIFIDREDNLMSIPRTTEMKGCNK
ncbi:MAG: alpha-D-ribose 1-methylphosphonate 5-triphosphate synthase subunit PhnH [Methanothermococcus sp.]|nr:alpha-D-ribose 1-methylphosphonate 5-triphosphate synthase subunit PhnH [Methanothermococcus sp.]